MILRMISLGVGVGVACVTAGEWWSLSRPGFSQALRGWAPRGFGVSSDKFGYPINIRPQKRSTVSFGSNLPLMASSSQSLPDPQRNPR